MTLPEVRFMQDRNMQNHCIEEAKRRVQPRRGKDVGVFYVLRYMFLFAILHSLFDQSFLKAILGIIVINSFGTYMYWLIYRKKLRLTVREVIRELSEYCTGCGYSSKGNISGTCPECGTKIDPQLAGNEDESKVE